MTTSSTDDILIWLRISSLINFFVNIELSQGQSNEFEYLNADNLTLIWSIITFNFEKYKKTYEKCVCEESSRQTNI